MHEGTLHAIDGWILFLQVILAFYKADTCKQEVIKQVLQNYRSFGGQKDSETKDGRLDSKQ